ncbi:MAG: histidine kinase [Chitinophagaceae bacterium]
MTNDGGWGNFIYHRVIFAFSTSLLIAIAFTYSIIHFILPRIITKKNWVITIGICLVIFCLTIVAQYFGSLRSGSMQNNSGFAHPVSSAYSIAHAFKIVLFNFPTVAGVAVSIKLLKRWWLKQKEAAQASKEKISAELQLLKAQVHPHFLFNSLNNIYSFALEGSARAPEMIKKLSGLLHYMIYECKKPQVPLKKELNMIDDYISLEKIRYGERLRVEMQIQQDRYHYMIAPLLLIPFVENSFKHGTSKMLANPFVFLSITGQDDILYFKLTNTKPSGLEEKSVYGNCGIGLKNVNKRLELLYPRKHELQIIEDASSFSVWLKIDLTSNPDGKVKKEFKKEIPVYELA